MGWHSAMIGIHSNTRTVCHDKVIHTTVSYNMTCHDASRKYEPIGTIRFDTIRSLPVELTYDSFYKMPAEDIRSCKHVALKHTTIELVANVIIYTIATLSCLLPEKLKLLEVSL